MKLTVVLGASQEASFDITLNDNSFTTKWVEELRWCLLNCEFDQQEAFATLISLEQAELILKNSCAVINRYLKNFIDIRDDILSQPQDYFNYLHVIFEKLSGEYSNPTKLVSVAPYELKQAIRNLNFFIHRVETKEQPNPSMYISFNKDQYRRLPLATEDYAYFQFTFPKGTLFLHYAELGKEYTDLYEDNLTADYQGTKNLHYYSGEAFLSWDHYDVFADQNYLKWLQDNGIDPYNKLLGHGKIPLGTVDDLDLAEDKIKQYRHIHSIIIKE
jgi:hypothetical protein